MPETIGFVMPGCLSAGLSVSASVFICVRMEQLGCHWTDFREILCMSIFRKYVEKIQFSLKFDKDNEHFSLKPMYI